MNACYVAPVVSDSVRPYGLQPTRFLCQEFSRQEYRILVGCCALLQGIFQTQGSNPHLLYLTCIGRQVFYHWCLLGSPQSHIFSPQTRHSYLIFPEHECHGILRILTLYKPVAIKATEAACNQNCYQVCTAGQGF